MLSYESDDDEFRSAWESSFSAEKQCHIAQRRSDKVQSRIENVKEQLQMYRQEAEESLKTSAVHSNGLSSVKKCLGETRSSIQVGNLEPCREGHHGSSQVSTGGIEVLLYVHG